MAEPNIKVNESSSIDEVQRWKVGTLKEYCSRRGLPISGKHKDELAGCRVLFLKK